MPEPHAHVSPTPPGHDRPAAPPVPAGDQAVALRLEQALGEIAALRVALVEAEAELAQMPQLEADMNELNHLVERLLTVQEDRDAARTERDQARTERDSIHTERARLQHEYELLASRYTTVISSSSWRLTAPLRNLAKLARG